MLSRIQSLGSCLIGLMLLLFAGSAAAEDVSSSCAAAIDRAAGSYSRCLLGAQSRNARRPGASRLEIAEQRCVDRFDAATARALARAERRQETCTPYLSEIAERTATYAESVATEAQGLPAASFLFVQNGTGGTLSETTLTLTDVSSRTGWFTDRPYRHAGQVPTEEFVSQWDEGASSFGDVPPNADFTCESGGVVVNYVVELSDPSFDGDDLSYAVAGVGDTNLPQALQCESDSHMFIDGGACMAGMSKETAEIICGLGAVDVWGLAACACVVQYVELFGNCSGSTGRGWFCACTTDQQCSSGTCLPFTFPNSVNTMQGYCRELP